MSSICRAGEIDALEDVGAGQPKQRQVEAGVSARDAGLMKFHRQNVRSRQQSSGAKVYIHRSSFIGWIDVRESEGVPTHDAGRQVVAINLKTVEVNYGPIVPNQPEEQPGKRSRIWDRERFSEIGRYVA